MIVTRAAASAMYVLAATLIVASLALSMPASSCWCAHDEHAGMLLHPLFPHHHADDHPAFVDDSIDDLPASSTLDRSSASVSPSMNGTPGDPGTGGFGGAEIVLPTLPTASPPLFWRWRLGHTLAPDQPVASPLTPPPRGTLAVLSSSPLG
jgi:hypothetical protein